MEYLTLIALLPSLSESEHKRTIDYLMNKGDVSVPDEVVFDVMKLAAKELVKNMKKGKENHVEN